MMLLVLIFYVVLEFEYSIVIVCVFMFFDLIFNIVIVFIKILWI